MNPSNPTPPHDGGPLLTLADLAGLLRLPSTGAARKYVARSLPSEAVIRIGRRVRVRREALMRHLGLELVDGAEGREA